MAKKRPVYLCGDCGDSFPQPYGKCPSCGAWGTVKLARGLEAQTGTVGGISGGLGVGQDLSQKMPSDADDPTAPRSGETRQPTGNTEMDRVLGGGLVPGSVVLFGGTPGVGKSTLSLQVFAGVEGALYFSGEESRQQVIDRLGRVHDSGERFGDIYATHSLEDIVATITAQRPPLAIIDSIQMIGAADSSFGTMSQIRRNAETLVRTAKAVGTALLIIGHVTKADELAGPRVLEHLVDTVLYLEGERTTDLRVLRSAKNRYGSTLEVGVFQMVESGLRVLHSPSEYFLAERASGGSGSAVTVVREGVRNFVLEVQALVVKSHFGNPRRTAQGVAVGRLHVLLAVLTKFTRLNFEEYDAYVNVISGLQVRERGSDLGLCAALVSSRLDRPVPADTVLLGEVGLGGEVRNVPQLSSRIATARQLGFTRLVVPQSHSGDEPDIVRVGHICQLSPVLWPQA